MMMSQISHSGLSPTFAQSQDKLTNEEVVQAAPALREAVQPCATRQAIAGVETGLHGTSQGKLVLRVWALHPSTRHGAAAILTVLVRSQLSCCCLMLQGPLRWVRTKATSRPYLCRHRARSRRRCCRCRRPTGLQGSLHLCLAPRQVRSLPALHASHHPPQLESRALQAPTPAHQRQRQHLGAWNIWRGLLAAPVASAGCVPALG